ncbi:MAG: hypothetical protein ACOYOA_15665 [Saprospiraceae bacterium]
MKKEDFVKIAELSLVLVVSSAMYIYGLLKYFQFDNQSDITKSVSELTGMELMWAFYGYSKPYAVLLGILEIMGGTLLLIRKTRIIGGLFLTGILMNVIAQDFFYSVNEGALRAAILYQVMIFAILWMNRFELIAGTKAMLLKGRQTEIGQKNVLLVLISILIAILLKFLEYKLCH